MTLGTTDDLTPIHRKTLAVNRVTALILKEKKKLQLFHLTRDASQKSETPNRAKVSALGFDENIKALLHNQDF